MRQGGPAVNESPESHDRTIACALLRIFLGVNIAVHGISRVLQPSKFRAAIDTQFAHSPLPHPTVIASHWLALGRVFDWLAHSGRTVDSLRIDLRSIAHDRTYIRLLPHSGLADCQYPTRLSNGIFPPPVASQVRLLVCRRISAPHISIRQLNQRSA